EPVRVELDVKFDFDKAAVKPESQADIKALADFMSQYPQTTTVVEGHTDSVGTDAYNQGLSERRANAVRDVLVNQYGVGADRVSSVGYGESRPVADNATAEGRAINRRVEVEVEARPKVVPSRPGGCRITRSRHPGLACTLWGTGLYSCVTGNRTGDTGDPAMRRISRAV